MRIYLFSALLFFSASPALSDTGSAPSHEGVSPRCEAALDRAAGRYSQCLLKANAKFAKKSDGDRLFVEQRRCEDKFNARVARAGARFGEDACTSYGDQIAGRTATCAEEVSTLAGGDAHLFAVGQAQRPYTWNFVDALKAGAQKRVQDQGAPSGQSGFDCSWSIDRVAGPEEKHFACAMKLKYELALLAYDLYAAAQVAHESDPLDPGKNLFLRHMNYIVGLSGYWEIGVASLEKTVLAPACSGTVTEWRTAARYIGGNKASVYFPALTSTMADVLLGLLTAFFNETLGTEAALYWGAYQEAYAQASIETNMSGWYFKTDLNPRGPIQWLVTQPGDEDYQYPQSLLPQMVWLTLPVDILAYEGIPDLERLRVEEKGGQYIEDFATQVYPPAISGGAGMTLLEATRQMSDLMEQLYPDCSSDTVLADWKDATLPIEIALSEGGELAAVLPQAVSSTENAMGMAIALTEKLQEEIAAFDKTGADIDTDVETEYGQQTINICDLYDGAIQSLPVLNRMSCLSSSP